jgi:hypothetical protein
MADGEAKYRVVVEGPAAKYLGLTGKLVVNLQCHCTDTSQFFTCVLILVMLTYNLWYACILLRVPRRH